MNYGELTTEIKALAFEEDDTIEEYIEQDVIPTAINRAISMIGSDVLPIISKYEISQDGTDTEYQYYDMESLTKGKFIAFDKNPVRIDDGDVYTPFSDYDIESGDTLVIAGDISGTFTVFYKSEHTKFVADGTMNSTEIPLKKRVHFLVPLLASYFVWLDDDKEKATQYYNLYETEAQLITMDIEKPRLRVQTGFQI